MISVTWNENENHYSKSAEGSKLVICCEGNAGFYGSTGTPYPEQETMAADAVMQFAIHKLGFKVEDIIVTGWSIGGFSSTWLAMNYPEISGLVRSKSDDG